MVTSKHDKTASITVDFMAAQPVLLVLPALLLPAMTNPAEKGSHKPLILIVETEAIIAMDVAMQLRDLGYEALGPATSGEQAIEMAGRLHPQLVLLDVHLGSQMDGITAAKFIREQFSIPCIFLSGFTNKESLAQAKPVGFLAKPFTEQELRTVVEAALAKM